MPISPILPNAELGIFNTMRIDAVDADVDQQAAERQREAEQAEAERQQREAEAKSLALFERVQQPEPVSLETRIAPDPGPDDVPLAPEQRPGPSRFSPYDDIFRKYAGPQGGNDELISIIAAGAKAEGGFDPNSPGWYHGDNDQSLGLFQIHNIHGLSAEYRLNPETASSYMVPKYVAAYNEVKNTDPGLSGTELASLVAAMAEHPFEWEKGSSAARNNYRRAYAQVMNGAGADTVYTPVDDPNHDTVRRANLTQNLIQLGEINGQPMTVAQYNRQRIQAIDDEIDARVKPMGGLMPLTGSVQPIGQPFLASQTRRTYDDEPGTVMAASVPGRTPAPIDDAGIGMPIAPPPPLQGSSTVEPSAPNAVDAGSNPVPVATIPQPPTPTDVRGGPDITGAQPPVPQTGPMGMMGPTGPTPGLAGDTQLQGPQTYSDVPGSIPGGMTGNFFEDFHRSTQGLRDDVPGVEGANQAIAALMTPTNLGGGTTPMIAPGLPLAQWALGGEQPTNAGVTPIDVAENVALMGTLPGMGPAAEAAARKAPEIADDAGRLAGRVADRLAPELPEGLRPVSEPFLTAGGGTGDNIEAQIARLQAENDAMRVRQGGTTDADLGTKLGQIRADAEAAPRMVPEDMEKLVPNLAHLDIDDGLKNTLIRNAEENRGAMETAQRGTVSWETTQANAAALNMTPQDFMKAPIGSWNQDEITALRATMVDQLAKTGTLAERVAKLGDGDVAEGVKALSASEKLDAFNQMVDLAKLESVTIGAKATAGRTLNALKMDINATLGRALTGTPEAVLGDKELAAQKLLSKWAGGNGQVTDEMLSNFLQVVQSGDPQAAARFLRGINDPGWWSRIQTLRYGSMLSSTITQTVQALSNTMNLGTHVANQVVMSGIESALRPRGMRAMNPDETIPMLQGMKLGAMSSLKEVAEIIKNGATPSEMARLDVPIGFGAEHIRIAGKQPFSGDVARAVDFAAEAPSRFMMAGDWVVRTMATEGRMAQLATRQAIEEGLSGPAMRERVSMILQNRDQFPKMAQVADDFGKKIVFQEQRRLTDALVNVRNVNTPVVGKMLQVGVPFVRTPVNVVAQGFENSPLGFLRLMGDVPAYQKAIRARELAQASGSTAAKEIGSEMMSREQMLDSVGHAMIGTGVMGLGLGLTSMGLMTGASPETSAQRNVLPPGWQPWSVRVGDHYVSLANIGPLAIPLASGAVLASMYREKKGDSHPDFASLARVGNIVTQQTFLQSLKTYLDFAADPDKQWEPLAENLAAPFAPYGALTRQMERVIGMVPRDPHGALEAIEANLPILAGNVKPKLDVTGQPESSQLSGPLALVAPLRVTESQDTPWLAEMRKQGIGLASPARKENGNDIPGDQYFELKEKTGQNIAKAAPAVMAQRGYAGANAEQQKKMLETGIGRAREEARLEVGVPGARSETQPWKYVGITDVRKEQQIDDLVSRWNSWNQTGRKMGQPLPLTAAQVNTARTWESRISPQYRQWEKQNRTLNAGARGAVNQLVGVP